MSAAAATRRSSRQAARAPAAAAAEEPLASPEVAAAVAEQPRAKRQRKAAAAAAAVLAEAAVAELPTGEASADEDDGASSPTAAAAAAPKRRGPKPKTKAAGPTREMEEELWQQGYARVAGVDEAGRGPLAGPVVAAACVLPAHVRIEGLDDSKKLSEERREELYAQLTAHPDVQWAAKVVEAGEIDTINILQAALKAMEGAAAGLPSPPDFLLVDGNRLPKGFDPDRARPVVKGDARCLCIAAASVIAKVTRDRLMLQLHESWPQYNFAGHKGYCVPEHVEAIRRHGPCPQHRRTFAPIKTWFPLEPRAAAEEEVGEEGSQQRQKKGAAKGKGKAASAAAGGRRKKQA